MSKLAFDQTKCPKCEQIAVADFVDNGVGMQQCGPFGCEACGWVEEHSPMDITRDDLECGGWL